MLEDHLEHRLLCQQPLEEILLQVQRQLDDRLVNMQIELLSVQIQIPRLHLVHAERLDHIPKYRKGLLLQLLVF